MRALLARRPFEPFEIHLSNGEVYLVRHPEMAWVVGGRVYVHIPEQDYEVTCSLLHIASVRPAEPMSNS
jgi:hypothetical protein